MLRMYDLTKYISAYDNDAANNSWSQRPFPLNTYIKYISLKKVIQIISLEKKLTSACYWIESNLSVITIMYNQLPFNLIKKNRMI